MPIIKIIDDDGTTLAFWVESQAKDAIDAARLLQTTVDVGTGAIIPTFPNWREYLAAMAIRLVMVPAAQQLAATMLSAGIPTSVTITLPTISAVHGNPVNATATASGGSGSGYTWSASGLPTGLSMNTSGVISGSTTVTGATTYTASVTDSIGNVTSKQGTVTIT